MPEKATIKRARKAAAEGKSPSTQAGEFVREEIHHIRQGKHGARSPEQAVAIGLSKARRAGIKLRPPKHKRKRTSRKRSPKRETGRRAVSHRALARIGKRGARARNRRRKS
jgi:hypothetical protein